MEYANQESKMIKPKQHERTDLLCIHEMLSHFHRKCRNILNSYATSSLKNPQTCPWSPCTDALSWKELKLGSKDW